MTTTATAPRRRPSLRSVEARNALVADNLNLVYGYLHRCWPRYATDDDVTQAGRLGLIRAAELWDETRTAFSTYAEQWMRHFIAHEVQSNSVIRVPRQRSVKYAGHAARAVNVGTFVDADGRDYDPPAREQADDEQDRAEIEAELRWAMERMSKEDAAFLEAKFIQQWRTAQIAEMMGRSRTRVKQIQQKVMERLYRVLHEKGLF